MRVTIAVDAMGGDHGPPVTVASSLRFLEETPDASIVLVGREDEVRKALRSASSPAVDRVTVQPATEIVAMNEPPADALRRKKDSSMRVAVNLVKSGQAQACVSAGNTGALMAISRFVLKTLPGIDRPAIASQLPTRKGVTTALDLGANVNCTPEQLLQFAVMGSALAAAVDGIERPSIGLLNIGEEDIKGHEVVQAAHALLATSGLNYVGFVEGDDIFSGDVDVVVTDGFTGNVALKTMEGVAGLIANRLRQEFQVSVLDRFAGLVARPVLRRAAASLDPRRYNGACMVGLSGIVVKSHGRADGVAFARAIGTAALAARRGLTSHIAQALRVEGAVN